MTGQLLARLEDVFWTRHSNPKSGWSRLPTGPVLVYAVYRRDGRLAVTALVWTVVNPFLFSPPDTEAAWMTRAVLAEQWWIREEGNSTLGATYPNVCNAVGAVAFVAALLAAWRRRPVCNSVASALAFGSKLWWLRCLVRRYDARGT